MASSIKLEVNFSDMLEKIKKAGGDIDDVTMKCAQECAKTIRGELVSEAHASGVPSNVTEEIQHNVTKNGNRFKIEAGWKLGEYNPGNPSAGYKAIFLNYGTARRAVKKERIHHVVSGKWKTLGTNRGAVTGRGFIDRAQKGAKKKIKAIQKDAVKKTLKELT